MSMLDHTLKSDAAARRLEVIRETDDVVGSNDAKARIVEETLALGAVIFRRRRVPPP